MSKQKKGRPKHRPKRKYPEAKRQLCQPELKNCPYCGEKLLSTRTLHINKYVQKLDGPINLRAYGYYCAGRNCPHPEKRYRAVKEVLRASLPHGTYGLDVIAFIGWQHDREYRQYKEIKGQLEERGVEISERHVGRLYRQYLALLGGLNEELAKRLKKTEAEYGGVIWALDGLQPGQNGPQMYVLYEVLSGEAVAAAWLEKRDQVHLQAWLEAYGGLKLKVLATLSDGEEAEIGAMQAVWPDIPHQMCQVHFLGDIAKPLEEKDRSLRESLRESFGKLPPIPGSEETVKAGLRARTLELEPASFARAEEVDLAQEPRVDVGLEAKTEGGSDRGASEATVAEDEGAEGSKTVLEQLQALNLVCIRLCERALIESESQAKVFSAAFSAGSVPLYQPVDVMLGLEKEQEAVGMAPTQVVERARPIEDDEAVVSPQSQTIPWTDPWPVLQIKLAETEQPTEVQGKPLPQSKPPGQAAPNQTLGRQTEAQLTVRLQELERIMRQACVDALHRPSRSPSTFGGLDGYAQLQALVCALQFRLPKGDTSYLSTLLTQGQRALAETADLAAELGQAQGYLAQITHLLLAPLRTAQDRERPALPHLRPEAAQNLSQKVKQALKTKLATLANQARRGSVSHLFLTNAQRLLTKWEEQLFHCYDIPGLPAHNNALESRFNQLRRGQRRVSGRKETSALRRTAHFQILLRASNVAELEERLSEVSLTAYQLARERLEAAEERQRWLYRLHRWPAKTAALLVDEYLDLQHQLNSVQPPDP